MALSNPVFGTVAYSAQNGTTLNVNYPAGVVAGDVLILICGQKPSTANGGDVQFDGFNFNWLLTSSSRAAGGYGTTLGADTGNTNLFIFQKSFTAGTESGTSETLALTQNNVAWAIMARIPASIPNRQIFSGAAFGSRTTAPTAGAQVTVACTDDTDPTNFEAGDLAVWAMCIPTDVTTPNQFASHSVISTGATFGTAVEVLEPDSGTGNDIGGFIAYAAVTAGASTTAPSVRFTPSGTVTNVRGPIALLRVREKPPIRTGDFNATESNDTLSATGTVPVIRTGTFAATEANDTLAATGKVIVKGSLAATETGADTLAATGRVIVKGSLAATETGTDTLAASGTVSSTPVTGTFAATETGADTLAATGKVIVRGTFAATETGTDTLAATGKVIVRGTFAATETGSDTLAATGKVYVKGSFAATETGADTLAATGKVLVKGSFAATETGADTLTSTGKVIVQGSLAATETNSDTAAATGKVLVEGSGAATETGNDVLVATGGAVSAGIFAATETGNDTAAASGKVYVKGSLAATETAADTLASTGQVLVKGSFAATETNADTLAATGKVVVSGSMAATETGADALVASGRVLVQGTLAAAETGADTLASTGKVYIEGALAATESPDTLAAIGSTAAPGVTGAMAATETGSDTLASTGRVLVQGTLDATEDPDTCASTGKVLVQGAGAASETGNDTLASTGQVIITGTGATTETGDDSLQAAGIVRTPTFGTFAATELPDSFGGYVAPGYVDPGYVGGVNGTVGGTFAITGAQAQLLRRLHALHGLAGTLTVGQNTRSAGDLVQSISEAGDKVTVTTTAGSDTFSGSVGAMIEELAALHGLTVPLEVTATQRRAGTIVQTLAEAGGVSTVTRVT